ncbi:hypothetical protein vseg_016617 [Gypsophila vaccaria]
MSTPPFRPLSPPPVSNLLFDVIAAEILPRLPAKSLLRFKTVCKSFNTLISSSEFIRLHLRHALSSDHRLLAIPSIYRTLHTFDLGSLSSPASAASAIFLWPEHSISVVGSYHGLLLITTFFASRLRLVLLNPCTRTYVDVPSTGESEFAGFLGFGFDHLSNDYKIVVAPSPKHHPTDLWKTRVTKIYSVNSKSWKIVDSQFVSDHIKCQYGSALVNNHLLHWLFRSPTTRARRICCFDVCLENWRDDVPLPAFFYDHNHENYFLDFGVVDGRLFSSFKNQIDLSYDVWVMKEYGVQESWMKLISIPISDDLKGGVVPITCREGGSSRVLLRQRFESNLFWYNTVDGVISKVEVPNFCSRRPFICEDTLVSLPGAKLFGAVYEQPVEQ